VLFLSLAAAAQEPVEPQLILRSTLSMSASHTNERNNYILQQSVGQSSVIGDYESDGYLLSQGFVQAGVWAKIVHPDDVLDLKAEVFPNPFVDEVNISFLEPINEPIHVFVFNDLGREVEFFTYEESQALSVCLGYLPPGKYYVKIVTDHKQFVAHLIKLE
jgi:hypothetical protein